MIESKDLLMLLWPAVTALAVGWASRLINRVQANADAKVEKLYGKVESLRAEMSNTTAQLAAIEVRLDHLEER